MPSRSDLAQRAFDLLVGGVGLVVSSPIWVGAAVAVRATSPGPILHRATRVGRNGRPFTLYKFRSMRVGAATSGPAITAAGDSRITTVGRVLRRTKLDELPQLLNVLKGEMSIVGPRPEDPRYVASYSRRERQVLQWRPGITSPASIKYRNEEAVLASMGGDVESAYVVLAAEKIETDLAYLQRRSVLGDLKLVIRTAIAVIGR